MAATARWRNAAILPAALLHSIAAHHIAVHPQVHLCTVNMLHAPLTILICNFFRQGGRGGRGANFFFC